MTPHSGYPQLSAAQHQDYAIRALRAAFLAQPPQRQAETRARVQLLLEAERRRKQNQPSYLMQHAKEIYGL